MVIRWLFTIDTGSNPSPIKELTDQIYKINFGIGIDCGEVYVFRSGIPDSHHDSDLIFMGHCVNFAVFLSQKAKARYYIQISEKAYSILNDEWKFGKDGDENVDMWTDDEVKGKDNIIRKIKKTSWYSHIS